MTWTEALPYFPKSELACKHCGEVKLDLSFASRLPALRQEWGAPLSPTSVCRCSHHNEAVGGHPRSLHLTENPVHPTDGCMAADIAWGHWPEDRKLQFAQLAWKLGWSLGLNDSFIHIDRRTSIGLPQHVFTYAGYTGSFDAAHVTGD